MTAPALRTTNWDALIAASPVNRQAAIARDARGWDSAPEPEREPASTLTAAHHERWLAPPKMRVFTKAELLSGPFVNLQGRRVGKLLVCGVLAEKGGANCKARWVVRCECGAYEVRSAKALKASTTKACGPCTRGLT